MKRYSATALAKEKGIAPKNLLKSFERHGIKPDRNGKWTEADYLKAKEMGAAMDKRNLSAKMAEAEKAAENKPAHSAATLTYMKMQRQIKRLDIDIQLAQVGLDAALGKSILLEKHKEQVQAVVRLMLTWWDQAAEAAATKIKDASVLEALRNARDRASREILELD